MPFRDHIIFLRKLIDHKMQLDVSALTLSLPNQAERYKEKIKLSLD